MHIGQAIFNGAVNAAIFEKNGARRIRGLTFLDLLKRSEAEKVDLPVLAAKLADSAPQDLKPILPIHPPEVWGCGCTYETSASFRDGEHGTREGMYAYVYREARPEVFFKGTARVCTGPDQGIGIRVDSKFTAPEPELAIVLGSGGRIAGFTLANDVSAWDIERENALYLTQSKVYNACCALGPVILTSDSLPDPYQLNMTCTITRAGKQLYSGGVSTAKLHRKLETLVEFLTRSNKVPCGTVLLTGTGIIVTHESALAPGDVVTITVPEIGALANPAVVVE